MLSLSRQPTRSLWSSRLCLASSFKCQFQRWKSKDSSSNDQTPPPEPSDLTKKPSTLAAADPFFSLERFAESDVSEYSEAKKNLVAHKVRSYSKILKPKDMTLVNKGEVQQELEKTLFRKPFEQNYVTNRPIPDPLERTIDCLKPDKYKKTKFLKKGFNAYYDVCIIGGGIMGCAIAYFMASRINKGLRICVVEKDPTYQNCTTTLSVGGLRQQFSLPENIRMSMYGADFLRQAQRLLYVHGVDMPEINFQPHGYLFLATDRGADTLEENFYQQMDCGAKVELMSPSLIKKRFPWINTDGIALGSYGYENEGWFDPWALMTCLKGKAIDLGVDFIDGEVYNIAHKINTDKIYTEEEVMIDEERRLYQNIKEAHIYLADGDVWPINSCFFIVAAGAESGHIGHLCGLGIGNGLLSIPLPVEPRKRYVYGVHAPDGPGLNCPLVVDPSGTYFRREGYGGYYLCGRSPLSEEDEPSVENLDVDYNYFEEKVWPELAKRAPGFNNCKVKNAWAGYYDYNYWDQNAIVGPHPYFPNLIFATGFSGHGLQQAPAIGRAISEWIFDDNYATIDLTNLGFERFLESKKVEESNIV